MFLFFSFVGWIWESIFCTISKRHWDNRGFLYGPVCPIYGFGVVMGLFFYDAIAAGKMETLSDVQLFIMGFIASIVLEYPTSYVLEKRFKARWWDYSDLPLNINGRTSVPSSCVFGAGSILFMKVLIPFFDSIISKLSPELMNLSALIIVALMSMDTTLTVSALTDFEDRIMKFDDEFQNLMVDNVDRMFAQTNHFYRSAIRRIAVFKLPENKLNIAIKMREEKLSELIREHFKQNDKDE